MSKGSGLGGTISLWSVWMFATPPLNLWDSDMSCFFSGRAKLSVICFSFLPGALLLLLFKITLGFIFQRISFSSCALMLVLDLLSQTIKNLNISLYGIFKYNCKTNMSSIYLTNTLYFQYTVIWIVLNKIKKSINQK